MRAWVARCAMCSRPPAELHLPGGFGVLLLVIVQIDLLALLTRLFEGHRRN